MRQKGMKLIGTCASMVVCIDLSNTDLNFSG